MKYCTIFNQLRGLLLILKIKKFLAIFMGVIAVLIIILGFFIFNSISDSNVDYYADDIGGYTFNIPDFF